MITNFEIITSELTEEEVKLLPVMIKGFNLHKKSNPIKASEIVNSMNDFIKFKELKIKMTEVRLRKFVNHIRINSLLPLIATSKGYFVSDDPEEIKLQVKSLWERAKSIKDAADGLVIFIKGEGVTP